MDWSNELYVKVYRRETADDLVLTWEARALWHEMLKRFDRSGLILARRGAHGLAALVRMPAEVVERVLAELLEDGRVQATDGGWVAPNFMDAQETGKSNRVRQQELRDRRRTKAITQTSNGASREVTGNNGASRGVTDSNSDLIRSELSRSDLSRGARARDLVSAEGKRNPDLRWFRSPLNPNEFDAFDGDDLVGTVERIGDEEYRVVQR